MTTFSNGLPSARPPGSDRAGVITLLRDLADTLKTYLLPGSVVLYIIGFVVAIGHFQYFGVPAQALGQAQFIAAGVVFFIVTALPLGLGHFVGGRIKGTERLWYSRVIYSASVLIGIGAWLVIAYYVVRFLNVRPMLPLLLYMGVIALLGVSLGGTVNLPELRANGFASGIAFAGCFLVTSMASILPFSLAVFGTIPQSLGGGQPRAVAIHFATVDGPAARLVSQYLAGGRQDCRRLFLAFSSEEYAYLEILTFPEGGPPCAELMHGDPVRFVRMFGRPSLSTSTVLAVRQSDIAAITFFEVGQFAKTVLD